MIPYLYYGGAEKVAADLSIYFNQNGYKVIIFVEGRQSLKEYQYGGKIVCVQRFSSNFVEDEKKVFFSGLMQDVREYRALKKRYKIDITISFMQISNLINIFSRCNDKVIVTLHNVTSMRPEGALGLGYGRAIFKYLYQLADKIVFVSEYCKKDWLEHYGDLFSKTVVINNPINRNHQNDMISEKPGNWIFGQKTVISVARLEGIKQQWHLLRAFKKVIEQCPDAQLLFAGDGLLKDALQNLSKQLGIDKHVYFLGFVTDIEEYLQKVKIAVCTSASESWSCATCEAMMQGVPIVTNDCPGGIRELMGIEAYPKYKNCNLITDCGIITPKLDGKKYSAEIPLTREECLLAEGILCLLNDEMLREKMSGKCIERAQKYKLDYIGNEWEEKILKVKSSKMINRMLEVVLHWTCVLLSFVGSINMRHKKKVVDVANTEQNFRQEKFMLFYNILEQWMRLREEGKSVEQYFIDYGYKKIAVYGVAKMANHLINELNNSSVEIVYGIDKRADIMYGKMPIITLDAELQEVDAIVVTAVCDYEDIKKALLKKVKCPIVSLEEVVYYSK